MPEDFYRFTFSYMSNTYRGNCALWINMLTEDVLSYLKCKFLIKFDSNSCMYDTNMHINIHMSSP